VSGPDYICQIHGAGHEYQCRACWDDSRTTIADLRAQLAAANEKVGYLAEEGGKLEERWTKDAHERNAKYEAVVAELERDVREARRLPNGWAQPCFVSVDDDGCLGVEWIFGEQGGPESWRVSFHWTPDEGAFTIRTPYDLSAQKVVEGRDAATFLARTLAGTGDLEPAEGEAK